MYNCKDIVEYHKNELLSYFDSMNMKYMLERKRHLINIDTREQVDDYIRLVKEKFMDCLGQIPVNTPLNAKVVNTLDKDKFLIDKVLIESYPGNYLTANFYYPKGGQGELPAVMFYCGHSVNGKACHNYVAFCVEAVLNGFCVLTFDPVGQGERKMYDAGDSDIFIKHNPDQVHNLLGQQAILTGGNLTQYMMLDNVKALDYLYSRNEVDGSRIAIGGNSGGGQMAAFMGMYDKRPAAVFSCCYITELAVMSYEIGTQESEQSLPGFMEQLLGIADLVIAAAPKPYFIGSALFDSFPINGTRDACTEIKRIYELLGADHEFKIYVAPKPHGFWCDLRDEALKFLCNCFNVDYLADKNIDYGNLPGEDELFCTKDGDVRSVNSFSLQRAIEKKWEEIRPVHMESLSQEAYNAYKKNIREKVIYVLKINPDDMQIQMDDMKRKYDSKSGMVISNFSFYSEKNMKIYASLLEKKVHKDKILVYVGDMDTKSSEFVRIAEKYTVFNIETRGTGKAKTDYRCWFNGLEPVGYRKLDSVFNCNAAILGRSLLGMRVLDLVAGITLLRGMEKYNNAEIAIYGNEEAAVYALFAAVIAGVDEIILEKMLASYGDLVSNSTYKWESAIFAHGILKYFDIPDLILSLLPAKITIKNFINHNKEPMCQMNAIKYLDDIFKINVILGSRSEICINLGRNTV